MTGSFAKLQPVMIVPPGMGFLDRVLGRDADSLVAKGDKLAADGRWGLARHEYNAALKALDRRPEAEQVRAKLTTCEGKLADERAARAEELAELGHIDEASAALREALELTSDNDAREALFRQLKALEEQAAADAEEEEAPAESEVEDGDFMGDSVEQRLELRLLGIADPVRADVYRGMSAEFQEAWLALEEGEGEAAVTALHGMVEGDETGYVQRELGRALLLEDRLDEAVDSLRSYLGDEPGEDPAAAESLAVALWRGEDAEEAVGVLDEVLAARSDRVGARVMLADIYLAEGQAEDAVEIAEEGLELGENDSAKARYAPLYHVLGAAQAVLGRDQEARDAWETSLGLVWRVDHDTQELHFVPETAWVLAAHLLKMGVDAEKAVDLLKALQSQPGSVAPAEIQMAMAAGLRRQGDKRGAIEALVAARTLMANENADGRARVDEALAELEDSP